VCLFVGFVVVDAAEEWSKSLHSLYGTVDETGFRMFGVLVATAIAVGLCRLVRAAQKYWGRVVHPYGDDPSDTPAISLQKRLRERAGRLHVVSWSVLVVIVLVVSVVLGLYLRSENLGDFDRLAGGIEELRRQVFLLKNSEKILLAVDLGATDDEETKLLRLIMGDVAKSRIRADRVLDGLEYSSDLRAPDSLDHALLGVISTRVGIVVLGVFLVQILVSLYRYTARLASFYDAKADALGLLPSTEGVGLRVLDQILTPASLDFGSVKPLSDRVVEAALKKLQQDVSPGPGGKKPPGSKSE
jgi:hypothetical protein